MVKARQWTSDEVGILKELYARPDITISDMGKVLNRSYNSVTWKAKCLGLRRAVSGPKIDIEYLKKLAGVSKF